MCLSGRLVYLGSMINSLDLHPILDMERAMQEAPQPWSIHKLKSYLRLLTRLNFLPNFSMC